MLITNNRHWHSKFGNQIRRQADFNAVMDFNDNRWASGFVDRDNKFAYEFQTTFNSSFWELYIFAVLKHLNLPVDFSHNSPDFVVKGHNKFNIEATTANHSKDGQAEWIRNYSKEEMGNWSNGKIVNNATIRIAGSFISKSNKFLKSSRNLSC